MKDETIDKEIEHFFNLSEKAKKGNLSEYDVQIIEKGIRTYLDALQSTDDDTLIKNHIKIMKTKGKLWEYEDLDIISTDLKDLILEALDEKDNLIKLVMEQGAFDEEDKKAINKFIDSTKIIKNAINIFTLELKLATLSIQKRAELSPTIDRKIKGKKPKKKKDEQIRVEKEAISIWKDNPTLTIEKVVDEVRKRIVTTKTYRTLCDWIAPFNPRTKK